MYVCVLFGLKQNAMKVEPKAKSDELDLHGEVWVLPALRGGANCVNPQLAPGRQYWRYWTFS